MNNYYDSWLHAGHLFINRVVMFAVLAVVLGVGCWWQVLSRYYGLDAMAVARSVLAIVRDADTELVWRIAFWEAMVIGALITACLFIWLTMRGRLCRSDQHLRGTRVVTADGQ